MKPLINKICDAMMRIDYFNTFKYRKRDNTFFQQKEYGKNMIHLDYWHAFDSELVVYPIYIVRFDILSNWFERFSFKSLIDQRNNGYVAFSGEMLNSEDKFYFNLDESNFSQEEEKLQEYLIRNSKSVFEAFSSLEKAYDIEIAPILNGTKSLPDIGADWFFENLTLCRIVHPEHYEKLKDIHLRHAKEMHDRGEPNISYYYDRIHEILTYMENLDFKSKLLC